MHIKTEANDEQPYPTFYYPHLTSFLSKQQLILSPALLKQFTQVFLSAINQQYLTLMFQYFFVKQEITYDIKLLLKNKYLNIFQIIKINKQVISQALLICNVKVLFKIHKGNKSKNDKNKMEDKKLVLQAIKDMIYIELGIDISLRSIELMELRLFKNRKRRLSLETKSSTSLNKDDPLLRLLPKLPERNSKSTIKLHQRSNSSLQIKNNKNNDNNNHKKILPILKSKQMNSQSTKNITNSSRKIKTQQTQQITNPYKILRSQKTQILKYKKVNMYTQVAESAQKALCQYQYQTPMKILSNNSMGMKMLIDIFKNKRTNMTSKQQLLDKKEQQFDKNKAEVIKPIQIKMNLDPEFKPVQKTRLQLFEQQLLQGKYKHRSKEYKQNYGHLFQ